MENAKRVLVIINPKSGKYKVRNQLFNIASFFSKCGGYETTVYTTNSGGEATKYARLLADKFDIIVCRGGDGTLNEVINGIMQSGVDVPLGYIPAGTTNDFAGSLGVPTDVREAVKIITQTAPRPHDIGLVNDNKYFAYTASCGIFTRASYSTSQFKKNTFGHAAYVFEGAKEARNLKSIPMKITCDGAVTEGEYLLCSVTNALVVGGIMKYSREDVSFDDGKMEMLLAKKPPNFQGLVKIVVDASNKKFDEKYITRLKGSEFTVECDGDIPWTIDGEYAGAYKTFHINCLHGALKIYKGVNGK